MFIIVNNTVGKRQKFLPKLLEYLEIRKVKYVSVDDMEQLEKVFYKHKNIIKGFILSGSSYYLSNMKEKHVLMNTFAIQSGFPVLGICFGAQFIHTYFGGQLKKLDKTFCETKKVYYKKTGTELFKGVHDSFQPQFCLNFIAKELPDTFEISTSTIIEHQRAIVSSHHKHLPIYAIFFHPEFLKNTHIILDNFIQLSS